MPRDTTIGRLLLEDAVPQDLHAHIGTLDKKGTQHLFQQLAEQHPELYREVSKKLTDLGADAGYETGGYSFGPEHMRAGPETQILRDKFSQEVKAILHDQALTPKQRDDHLVATSLRYSGSLSDQVYRSALAEKNPLAMQVVSGAKGKPENLKSLIAGDTLYTDSDHNPVPYPVTHSFYEGLRPHEYFAGCFGARTSIISTKLGTAQGGWLSKRMGGLAHRLIVVSPDAEKHDQSVIRGYPSSVDEADNEGALLAHPAGGHERNTVMTRDVLNDLKRQGVKDVLVRSPMVGGPDNGGVYGKDVGIRERQKISPVGDSVGKAAADSLAEPLTQMLLCLALGTLVRMADGSEKPIELIGPGDVVLGSDEEGRTSPTQVVRRYDNGMRDCVEVTFVRPDGTEGTLEATADHKILCPNFMVGARQQPIGKEWLFLGIASGDRVTSFAVANRSPLGERLTFDLEVDNPDHLFVLANGLVVSNSSKHCLVAGTEVRMEHGCVKKIEDVLPGDVVYGADTSGRLTTTRVVRTFDNGLRWCVRTEFLLGHEGGGDHVPLPAYHAVESTTEHKILADVFDPACESRDRRLRPVAIDTTAAGSRLAHVGFPWLDDLHWMTIARLDREGGWFADVRQVHFRFVTDIGLRQTFDLEVDHPDHLFVLANGLIVSNSGGVAGSTKGQQGFPVINRLLSIPSEFPGGAVHSRVDGMVTGVKEAPQGGHYVTVEGESHYVPPGETITAKAGDRVEAGDSMTDGLTNPAVITATKGIGEGRKRFVETFIDVANRSGFRPNRRNVELIARGLIDHVRLEKETVEHAPGDVVSYTWLENHYHPREGHKDLSPEEALGQYLEAPVLHHSIGSKVRPSMLPALKKFGVKSVKVHESPPEFTPFMVRSQDVLSHDKDWMTNMLGSGLEKSLLRGVHRGAISDPKGTSFVPALAEGTNFGYEGLTRGFDVDDEKKR